MEFTTQYRKNKTTNGSQRGVFPATKDNVDAFEKDAFYKLTVEKVGDAKPAKQGRPKVNKEVASTSNDPAQGTTPEGQPATA